MHNNDEITARILAAVAALPLHEQTVAIHSLVSSALKQMPAETIHDMRAEITAQFTDDIPIVASTLALIDGQLALREIAEEEPWR